VTEAMSAMDVNDSCMIEPTEPMPMNLAANQPDAPSVIESPDDWRFSLNRDLVRWGESWVRCC